MWVKNTRSTRIGQTVFFRHKYITQPVATQTDAILRATDDFICVLKGRSAIDLLVDILKGYEGEPTKIEDQRAKMKKISQIEGKSEEEEAKEQDIHTEENEPI